MKRRGHPQSRPREDWQTRQQLAGLAARMLVAGEARGFRHAREKAAAALGLRAREGLVDDLTLLRALIEYQGLFDRDALPARNARLRAAALGAMRFLDAFAPRLHGPVLLGTTLADTPVGLYLFADEVEHVLRHLLQHGVPFNLRSPEARHGRLPGFPIIECHRDGVDFELTVLPAARSKQLPRSSLTGAPALTLDTRDLQRKFAVAPGACWLEGLPLAPSEAWS